MSCCPILYFSAHRRCGRRASLSLLSEGKRGGRSIFVLCCSRAPGEVARAWGGGGPGGKARSLMFNLSPNFRFLFGYRARQIRYSGVEIPRRVTRELGTLGGGTGPIRLLRLIFFQRPPTPSAPTVKRKDHFARIARILRRQSDHLSTALVNTAGSGATRDMYGVPYLPKRKALAGQ